MQSERIQQRIERMLAEADEAVAASDWARVRDRATNVLAFDPENHDAQTYLAAADRALGAASPAAARIPGDGPSEALPASFGAGRYEVKRFLGEGGKKRVYLAHDSLLDRDVAFALIKSEGLDNVGKERITREAQAMGRLGAHPNIVSVFDLGTEPSRSSQDGQPFMVTELMGGGDVEGLIERAPDHRVPLDQALVIADEVCRALEHAHTHGVVHRDLKPGNVWLTNDGTAKLGDFGLAVALDRSRLTQAGMMVGTVSYMPPEQAIGGEVTARSDLYSLGAMLYELVTGRPPFIGDESVAIITQHLNTPPVAPTWHRPDCPLGLEALILRLLEKDPSKRPTTASEVRQLLAATQGPELSTPTPESLAPTDSPIYRRTFVGREHELKQLQRAFDAALSGQGGLTMVVGEPGIGKTALCEQISTYVAVRGGKTLVGHCYEEGSFSLPYLAFVEAMRTYVLAREPDGLKQDLGSGAAEVARIVSEIRDRVQVELRPAGDPEDDRWRLLQAVAGFLRNATTVQPMLLVLEDLHWADRGTLDLLLHLARNLEGTRLLIAGTYRDVEVDRSHPLSSALADLRRIGSFQRVPLRGLTVDEVHRMMTNIRGQEPPWSRAEAIHRQTEGNPLFVQEVLRYLVEEGLVVREGGRYARTDGTDPEAGIPEGLRDVIGKRLSKLSPECNRLLSTAAVIGRDFGLQTLQRVADVPEDELLTALEDAARVGVLEQQARGGVIRFRFSHALFRQTLYEEIFAPRRIRLHQAVARALEGQYASRLEEHAAELAEHFAQSTDAEDLEKAVRYGEIAAKRAIGSTPMARRRGCWSRRCRPRRCSTLTTRPGAVTCCWRSGRPSCRRVRGGGYSKKWRKRPSCSHSSSGTASRHRGRAGSPSRRNTAHLGVPERSLAPVYRTWAERADRHAAPRSLARVMADIALGSVLSAEGRQQEERAYSARALDLARQLGDPQALFEAGQRMLRARWEPEGWGEQLALAEEFSTCSRDGVSTRPLGLVLGRAAAVFLAAGDRGRAEALWAEVEQLAKRTGDAEALLWPIQIEAMRAMLGGELEAALDAAAREASRAEELGAAPLVPTLRVEVLLYLGQMHEALGFLTGGGPLHAVGFAHAGHGAQARAEVARLLDPAAPLAQDGAEANALGYLLEAAVLTEDTDRAAGLAASLDGLTATTTFSYSVHAVGRHLGAAATLLGDKATAREHYARALDWATKIRHRPEVALTRLQLAELLLEHYPDERAEAIEHLDFAIEEFRAMKMQPSLARALSHRGLLKA